MEMILSQVELIETLYMQVMEMIQSISLRVMEKIIMKQYMVEKEQIQ
jgi:hypothetical protein